MMKVKEIKEVISSWCKVVNHRLKEIEQSPKLINDTLSFDVETGSLTEVQLRTILNDPACWYSTERTVEEFTIDDTYSKIVETSSVENSLRYSDGHIYLDVAFHFNFYRYSKFNCCTEEIDEECYEKWKIDNYLN